MGGTTLARAPAANRYSAFAYRIRVPKRTDISISMGDNSGGK